MNVETRLQISGRVKPGEIWRLGKHRLMCGDSRDKEQVERLMQGEKARLAITSPPYNLGRNATLSQNRFRKESKYLDNNDGRTPEELLTLLETVTKNALAVSETVIVNFQMLSGNKIALLEYLYRMRHDLADIAIWDKLNAPPAMGRNILNSRFEFLLLFSSRKRGNRATRTIHTANFRGTVPNVYRGGQQRRNAYYKFHAATFPMHLPTWLMETFDNEGGIVFDPFLGTGTTLMAAEEAGRVCYGMEIDPLYCDVVLHRYEQAAGAHSPKREKQH